MGSIDAVIAGNAMAGDLALDRTAPGHAVHGELHLDTLDLAWLGEAAYGTLTDPLTGGLSQKPFSLPIFGAVDARLQVTAKTFRSEEHTSELQSLMRISSAVFCLKKKNTTHDIATKYTCYK